MGKLAEKLKARPAPDSLLEDDRRSARERAERLELEAKYKAALAHIERLEQRVGVLTELDSRRPGKGQAKPRRHAKGEATAVLVLSDWHVEETIRPETVNDLNEFNLEIAAQRIARTFQKALLLLEDSRHLADVREMVVAVLGDLVSGYIHEELQENNALAPLPATMFAAEHLEAGLRLLLEHGGLERIIVPTCYGNHGRTTQKPRYATGADNSFEHNLYLHMARRFAGDKRVEWKIGPGYHNWLEIQGRQVRFHHGDAIKYNGGVGGITIPVNKAVAEWNKSKRADVEFFGHYHTWLNHWSWVSNGSLIGYGPYSLRIKAAYQPPVQTFAVIDRERGMTRALPIFCQ